MPYEILENRCTETAYTTLRKLLIRDGYTRIAPEVFMRVATNRKGCEKHYRRIINYIPNTGTVRILRLTERQYSSVNAVTHHYIYYKYDAPVLVHHSTIGASDLP